MFYYVLLSLTWKIGYLLTGKITKECFLAHFLIGFYHLWNFTIGRKICPLTGECGLNAEDHLTNIHIYSSMPLKSFHYMPQGHILLNGSILANMKDRTYTQPYIHICAYPFCSSLFSLSFNTFARIIFASCFM